jgi:hypothetical protein
MSVSKVAPSGMSTLSGAEVLAILRRGNTFDRAILTPLSFRDRRIGWVRASFAEALSRYSDVFRATEMSLEWRSDSLDFEERSAVLRDVLWALRALPGFGRWNDEDGALYDVTGAIVARVPRCAIAPLGLRSCGAHINGFFRTDDGPRMWIAERHARNSDFGGMFDTLAGGFISFESSPDKTAENEAFDEAGLDASRFGDARTVGTIKGVRDLGNGVAPYCVHCYDVEFAGGEIPANRDGEVAAFHAFDMPTLMAGLRADRFKFNAVPVVVDWLVRHGLVSQTDPARPSLLRELQIWDPDE